MKRSDIEFLKEGGLITAEQAERIYSVCNLKKGNNRSVLPVYLGSLGLLFILGGLISIMLDHWDSISDILKLCLGILFMGSAWAAWAFLRDRHTTISEVWSLIGCALWAGNIAMVQEIFQIFPPFCESIFIFFCGIVALPFLSKQRFVFWCIVLSSFILLISGHGADEKTTWLPLSHLNDNEFFLCFISLFLIWSGFGERWHRNTSFLKSYRYIGEMAMLLFLIFGIVCTLQFPLGCIPLDNIGCPALGVWCISCFLYLYLCDSRKEWEACLSMGIFLFFSVPMAMFIESLPLSKDGASLIGTFYSVLYGISLIYYGYKLHKIRFINYGAVVFILAEIAVCSYTFVSLSDSGFGLIVCGLVMLISGYFIDKCRRSFINKLRQNQTESDQ